MRGAGRTERAVRAAVSGLDERTGLAKGFLRVGRKAFPDHWSFLLGEIALYSFVVLLLTGTYLTFFFDASLQKVVYDGPYEMLQGVHVSRAYASTVDLGFEVRGGLLVRQIHHWAALTFVAAIGVHLLRILFTGAFRKPRELNWVIGVTLFVLAMAEGFAGYSLPDDALSGTGLRIAQGIMLAIPLVGSYVSFFVFGGAYPGEDIVSRLYTVHILLLPALLVGLVTVHLLLVFLQKHTQWAVPGRSERLVVGRPMTPAFSAQSLALFLMVFGFLAVLGGAVQINPIWLYGPYSPAQASSGSQPDWYIGFLEGALRLMPGWETDVLGHTVVWNVLVPALLLPGVMFGVLYAYPFLERWVTGDRRPHPLCERPRDNPVRTGLGAAAVTFYAVLLIAGGDDIIAFVFRIPLEWLVWILRVGLFVLPPLVFTVVKRACLGLQRAERESLLDGVESGLIVQTPEGGYRDPATPLGAGRRYVLTARQVHAPLEDRPRVRPDGTREALPGDRVRRRLSTWFFGDRVDRPTATRWYARGQGRGRRIPAAGPPPTTRKTAGEAACGTAPVTGHGRPDGDVTALIRTEHGHVARLLRCARREPDDGAIAALAVAVLAHRRALDDSVYGRLGGTGTVEAGQIARGREQFAVIGELLRRLVRTSDARTRRHLLALLAAEFDAHVHEEERVLLPALRAGLDDRGLEHLAVLHAATRRRTELHGDRLLGELGLAREEPGRDLSPT